MTWMVLLVLMALATPSVPAQAQSLGPIFKRVTPSVVVVWTREREDAGDESGRVTDVRGVGSGVLVSSDGQVITAAHVVHSADEITVEFVDGSVVR
jgi:serine protease Do